MIVFGWHGGSNGAGTTRNEADPAGTNALVSLAAGV